MSPGFASGTGVQGVRRDPCEGRTRQLHWRVTELKFPQPRRVVCDTSHGFARAVRWALAFAGPVRPPGPAPVGSRTFPRRRVAPLPGHVLPFAVRSRPRRRRGLSRSSSPSLAAGRCPQRHLRGTSWPLRCVPDCGLVVGCARSSPRPLAVPALPGARGTARSADHRPSAGSGPDGAGGAPSGARGTARRAHHRAEAGNGPQGAGRAPSGARGTARQAHHRPLAGNGPSGAGRAPGSPGRRAQCGHKA